MRNLLRLEEAAQFLLCVLLLYADHSAWWMYLLMFIGPDIGMLGYLISPQLGAITYNVLHHKGIAVLVMGSSIAMSMIAHPDGAGYSDDGMIAGIILYGHASMDRIFGYGLKFGDNFHHTHLGWIGKLKDRKDV